jgi:hypothetical protein
MPPQPIEPNAVFLNIPYDEEFRSLYVAYVVGLTQLGLVPHLASEIPGGSRRLDRILALIKRCRYSIHDLSRVEVSGGPPEAPRFNMPLKLGMTIAWAEMNPDLHTWFVWESEPYRIQRSTSDLNGTDANIHQGTVQGLLSGLRSSFWRESAPSVQEMLRVHGYVEAILALDIPPKAGKGDPYANGVFAELRMVGASLSRLQRFRQAPPT